jgi:regulator of replication initiation timing
LTGGEKFRSEMLMQATDVADMKSRIDERLEQIELLKVEMRKELKRLQRQDLTMQSKFDSVFTKITDVKTVVDSFDSRIILADNTMAIIFKLLRI